MPSNFTEYYSGKTGLTVGVTDVLFSEKSEFQKIEILETDTWGNLLTIDGMVMLSEKDEFVYHEMLTHVAMFTHPRPERVLIVGGGDGGTAREVLRHAPVIEVDLVEIDETVVRASKEFLPGLGAWESPKLNVLYEDATQYVDEMTSAYDLILVDGSDPVGPAKGLFDNSFIRSCSRALAEDGVFAAQTQSPWIASHRGSTEKIYTALDSLYPVAKLYLAHIPLYPAGMWSFCIAGKGPHPLSTDTMNRVEEGISSFGDQLRYYNEEVHAGCFALPNFVREIIC
ncbi:MAG: polyamine aminopropyltransferase [Balneolaceae bacterium]|nr:polyamine aminopropyltransferase [Balneolaceae bacterium]